MNPKFKKTVNYFLDLFLMILAVLVLVAMAREVYHIVALVFEPVEKNIIADVIKEVLTFLMLFEFIILLFRYITEGHHIPIRYLIYICITAVLRQILSVHGPALEVFLYALSILVLVFTLILTHNAMVKIRGKKTGTETAKQDLKDELKNLIGKDSDIHG